MDTSSFALKTNLTNLKSEFDKIDIDKLKPVPTNFSKLSDAVKNDVVKKTDYNKLFTKVDNIDTSGLVKKTDYNTKITEIEGKIPDTSSFVKKTDYNTKISEVEDKIPDTSNLATKAVLTAVENKIPDTSNLTTKILVNKVENRIPDISNVASKTALTTVENKIPAISSLVKKNDYNREITGIKINNLQRYSLSYFRVKQYFDEGSGKQNYLVFLPMRKYFKLNSVAGVADYVLSWQSKGISNENIKPSTIVSILIIVSIQD